MEYYWPAAAHSAGVKVHGQRVHRLGLHLAFQRGIHHLVARDGALALELGRDDDGEPVAVALHLQVLAGRAAAMSCRICSASMDISF
jgi:hypothetical protein